jgi:PAS domain S-box-containing protein
MEQPMTEILRRSSDAVVVIGLADGAILDVNEAFFTVTGHARHELVGRPARDLLVALGQTADSTAIEVLQNLGSTTDVPVGLWTRSGELRVGDLSALVLDVEGQRDALYAIRGVRDPTPGQRRSVAREELHRILRRGDGWQEGATRALQAFGVCLRWEFGAIWRGAPPSEDLRCAAIWRSPQSDLEQLEVTTRDAVLPPGMEPLRRAWLRGQPTWIPDIVADSEFSRERGGAGEPMHGWLGFPVRGAGGVIGVAEFLSREVRQPDAELLAMIDDFGRLFGRLLEGGVEAPVVRPADEARTARPGAPQPAPATVPAAFHDLAAAVAVATEELERHPTPPAQVDAPALLGELTAGIVKLKRLLEDASGAPVEPAPALPVGLTLKAVSRRTGIPAATLRTWEHRYGFIRPRRSPSGYRLYGEEEIARIEQVKYLVGQGVRIGAAMKAVMREEA